ncbi:MAG TPA: prenyltransferase, partial [Acidimicrobiia bacterium]|nr:prenyltransferase [Acidimicrobiia bacterium]
RDADVAWGWFTLAAVGLVLSHVANNLMNDLFDLDVGNDTEEYPRNLYAPHPVLSGMISRRGLAAAALAVNATCLAIMGVLVAARGWPIAAFAVGGFLLSAAYTAPPLRLKKRGLGEPTVLIVWGPMMVGGTYYAATGTIPGGIVLASLPYALLCTTVLMGKHIDKLAWDAPKHTNTLPVLLGEARARRVTQAMFVAFFASVIALVVVRVLPWATLLVVLSLPRMQPVWRAFDAPKPEVSPVPNPVWPLWFAPHAFLLTRRAGGLLALGLVVGAVVGW